MGLVRRTTDAVTEPASIAPVDTADLLRALDRPDVEGRRQAALGLDGVAEAVPALLARLDVETEPAVRDALLTTLAQHGTAAVAAALTRHLSSDDAGLRTATAEALATMREAADSYVPALLHDPDPDVRIMTAMVLADLHHPRVDAWLTEMIATDDHPNVVAAAIDAVLPSAGARHAAVLAAARDRFPDDPFLRFTVDSVLPTLPEPS